MKTVSRVFLALLLFWAAPATATECQSDDDCPEGATCIEGMCFQCIPSCKDKECGDDGCGGSCGECAEAWYQCIDGVCHCEPVCEGSECGDDTCGGSCGECQEPLYCVNNQCTCNPICGGNYCGPDDCGGWCECPGSQVCVEMVCASECPPNEITDCNGICAPASLIGDGECQDGSVWLDFSCAELNFDDGDCECQPDCEEKDCGDDGCGGTCWTSDEPECDGLGQCVDGVCVDDCEPDCEGKDCGDDGCGGTCGECINDCDPNCEGIEPYADPELCTDGVCASLCCPDCCGKICGDDGCSGICGQCEEGDVCDMGECVTEPGEDTGGGQDVVDPPDLIPEIVADIPAEDVPTAQDTVKADTPEDTAKEDTAAPADTAEEDTPAALDTVPLPDTPAPGADTPAPGADTPAPGVDTAVGEDTSSGGGSSSGCTPGAPMVPLWSLLVLMLAALRFGAGRPGRG